MQNLWHVFLNSDPKSGLLSHVFSSFSFWSILFANISINNPIVSPKFLSRPCKWLILRLNFEYWRNLIFKKSSLPLVMQKNSGKTLGIHNKSQIWTISTTLRPCGMWWQKHTGINFNDFLTDQFHFPLCLDSEFFFEISFLFCKIIV